MWLIPKTNHSMSSVCVQDMVELKWDLNLLASELAAQFMWSGKHTQQPCWSNRLKRVSWLQALCTRILKPSQQKTFRGCFDIIVGGYPCAPFSIAGSRKGEHDEHGRHLWPFIQRAIGFIRPRYCFFENVEGHLTLGLKDVCHDLDELGYEFAAGVFSAAECGAPHSRRRIFILARMANADSTGDAGSGNELEVSGEIGQGGEDTQANCINAKGELANPNKCGGEQDPRSSELRPSGFEQSPIDQGKTTEAQRGQGWEGWPTYPSEAQHEWEHPRILGNTDSDEQTPERGNDEKKPEVSAEQGQENGAAISGGASATMGDPNSTRQSQPQGDHEKSGGWDSDPSATMGNAKGRQDNKRRPRDLEKEKCQRGSGNPSAGDASEAMGNTSSEGLQEREASEQHQPISATEHPDRKQGGGETESRLGVATDGGAGSSHSVAGYMGPRENRIPRLRMLGNGVVPQTAAIAFLTLWQELNADE